MNEMQHLALEMAEEKHIWGNQTGIWGRTQVVWEPRGMTPGLGKGWGGEAAQGKLHISNDLKLRWVGLVKTGDKSHSMLKKKTNLQENEAILGSELASVQEDNGQKDQARVARGW